MPRPRIQVDLEKLELLVSLERPAEEIAQAIGISRDEFQKRRTGHGVDAPFREAYFRGREKARDQAMGEVGRFFRNTHVDILRSMIAAIENERRVGS